MIYILYIYIIYIIYYGFFWLWPQPLRSPRSCRPCCQGGGQDACAPEVGPPLRTPTQVPILSKPFGAASDHALARLARCCSFSLARLFVMFVPSLCACFARLFSSQLIETLSPLRCCSPKIYIYTAQYNAPMTV